ncbi:electron transfer flavoprotein regulatory factor 1 [Contarinia nasturtii]|uniref:electron transfer flavoprotein regulatory factor 1 n=1 Tax=Contarinia nasturtii TaxID=265458 RepID=UPI0012D3EF02|nr:electron transfer flavoprotein regulatory factor 1 [Contarinia nasturtii]
MSVKYKQLCYRIHIIQMTRSQVVQLYKTLQYLGREYPGGPEKFRKKCHDIFLRNSTETDPNKIKSMIEHGKFIVKELEALYSLRKYRAMKKRYYVE